MPKMSKVKWVSITHETNVVDGEEGKPSKVTEAAFESVWEPKGWTIVEDDVREPGEELPRSKKKAGKSTDTAPAT